MRPFRQFSKYAQRFPLPGLQLTPESVRRYLREVDACPVLSREDMTARFRELRRADLEYWRLVLSTPKLVEYWLREVYPTFRQEQASGFRRTDDLDAESIDLLVRLGPRATDSARKEYDQLLAAVCYELVYVVDGTHRFWEHVLQILGQAKLPPELPANPGYAQRVLEKDRSIAKLRETLVHANLRLVVTLINSMHKYYALNHMNYADAIQDGNIGLITAINRFDPDRDIRFSTFAAYWVKSILQRGESLQGDVRRPVRLRAAGGHVHEVVNNYQLLYNRKPTQEELLESLPEELVSRKALKALQQAPRGFVSLDLSRTRSEETPECYVECLTSKTPNPEQHHVLQDFIGLLRCILEEPGVLDKRELFCVRLYYGFGGTTYTLQEIGDILGLSRERIRQILNKVHRKLRHALARHQVTQHAISEALTAVHALDESPLSLPAR